MRLLTPESARGIAVGLWILTGLAFLVGALLPGSSGEDLLGPVLLTLSVTWTALLKPGPRESRRRGTSGWEPGPRESRRRGTSGWEPETADRKPERTMPLLLLAGPVLALGIVLTVVREGDRRSFLYVGFVTIAALALGSRSGSPTDSPAGKS